jgi:hypothetical protein
MLLAMQHCTNAMMLAQFADDLGYTPALKELHYAYLFDEKVYCDPRCRDTSRQLAVRDCVKISAEIDCKAECSFVRVVSISLTAGALPARRFSRTICD